jgi:hypothetical protein
MNPSLLVRGCIQMAFFAGLLQCDLWKAGDWTPPVPHGCAHWLAASVASAGWRDKAGLSPSRINTGSLFTICPRFFLSQTTKVV